jgi:hypothetical protein
MIGVALFCWGLTTTYFQIPALWIQNTNLRQNICPLPDNAPSPNPSNDDLFIVAFSTLACGTGMQLCFRFVNPIGIKQCGENGFCDLS